MPEREERGRADHRAVVGAEARTRYAQRMSNAFGDRFAEREVRRDTASEQDRLDRVLGRGARRLLGEHLGDRLLKRSGDVGDRHVALLLEPPHEPQHRGLQAAEREVEAIGRQGAGQRKCVRVALLRDPLDRRAPGETEMEQARDLVEGLARRIVDRAPERPEAAMRLHEDEIAVRAAHDEDDRGDLRLRRHIFGLVEPVRVDVSFEMIHADEWKAGREREAAPVVRADEKASDEPGAYGRRDRVDLGELPARVAQGFLGDDIDGVQDVERTSFPVPWPANAFRHELTQNKNARYLVAREGGRIVGYAGLWLMVDEAHITTFAVHPDHRRRRIGERMLVRIFELAAALNAEWLTLEVRASNLAAQKLYEKYGFRRAGVRRRYYSDNNEDALIMWTERLRERAVRDRLAKLKAELQESG